MVPGLQSPLAAPAPRRTDSRAGRTDGRPPREPLGLAGREPRVGVRRRERVGERESPSRAARRVSLRAAKPGSRL